MLSEVKLAELVKKDNKYQIVKNSYFFSSFLPFGIIWCKRTNIPLLLSSGVPLNVTITISLLLIFTFFSFIVHWYIFSISFHISLFLFFISSISSSLNWSSISLFVVLCQSLCYTGTAALLRSPSRGKEVEVHEHYHHIFSVCRSTGSSLLSVQVAWQPDVQGQ